MKPQKPIELKDVIALMAAAFFCGFVLDNINMRIQRYSTHNQIRHCMSAHSQTTATLTNSIDMALKGENIKEIDEIAKKAEYYKP